MRIFENCIYDHTTLLNLVNEKHTCVFLKQCVKRISLRPIYLNDVKKGIFENLRSSLKKYDTSLNGILLGYQNVKTMQNANTGKIIGRYGEFEVSISVEFFVFQPDIGFLLQGVVNFKSNSHIGCLIHKYFNAIILKPENVEFNEWNCKDVEINQKIIFEVIDRDFSGSVPYIKGKIPDESTGKEEKQVRRKTKNSRSSVELSLQNRNENEDDDFTSEIITNVKNLFKSSDDKNISENSLLGKLTSEDGQIPGTAVNARKQIDRSNNDEKTLKVKKKKSSNKETGSQKLSNAPDNAVSPTLAETKFSRVDTPCCTGEEFEVHKTKKKKRKKNGDDSQELNKNSENNNDFGDLTLPVKKKKNLDREAKRSAEECYEVSTDGNSFSFDGFSRTSERPPEEKSTSKVNHSFGNDEPQDFVPGARVTPSKTSPSLKELACAKRLSSLTDERVKEESETDGFGSDRKEKGKKNKSPHGKAKTKTEGRAEHKSCNLSKKGNSDEVKNPLSLYFLHETNHGSPRKSDADEKGTPNKSQRENAKRRREEESVAGLKNDSHSPPVKKSKLESDVHVKASVHSSDASEGGLLLDADRSLNKSADINGDKIINVSEPGKSTKESGGEQKKGRGRKNPGENCKKLSFSSGELRRDAESKEKSDGEKDGFRKTTKKVQKRLENFALFKAWVDVENRRVSAAEKPEAAGGGGETDAAGTANGAKASVADGEDGENVGSPASRGKAPRKRKTPKRKPSENEKSDKSSECLIDELLHWKKMNMEREIDLMPLKTSTPKAGTPGEEARSRSRQKKPRGKEADESSEYDVLLSSLIREKMRSMEMDVSCLDGPQQKTPKEEKAPKAKSAKGK